LLVDGIYNTVMLAKMKEKKPLEDWQIEDARSLRRLFDARTETVAEGKLISQMEFGAKYGIGSQGMVWQYLNAHRPLNLKAAVAFAKGLNVKVLDFSPTLAAQIDDASKHELERPALQLTTYVDEPQLQWVSSAEAALLSVFRACSPAQQQGLLAIATNFSSATGNESQTDGRPARKDSR
jgi:hypothetical protein